jgi:hypothetical protein
LDGFEEDGTGRPWLGRGRNGGGSGRGGRGGETVNGGGVGAVPGDGGESEEVELVRFLEVQGFVTAGKLGRGDDGAGLFRDFFEEGTEGGNLWVNAGQHHLFDRRRAQRGEEGESGMRTFVLKNSRNGSSPKPSPTSSMYVNTASDSGPAVDEEEA